MLTSLLIWESKNLGKNIKYRGTGAVNHNYSLQCLNMCAHNVHVRAYVRNTH